MELGIISTNPHTYQENKWISQSPLNKIIDSISTIFKKTRVLTFEDNIDKIRAPDNYKNKIEVKTVPFSGGKGKNKISILKNVPSYLKEIRKIKNNSDILWII